jgi:acyl carrier protein
MANIEEKVKALIADHLGIDASEVTKDQHFEKDLNADSLDVVELTMMFEKEFQINIPDEEMQGFATVGDAIECVMQHVS